MRIIITGILGYIGSELSKLYSGEARVHDIIGIDNRFISQRVAQLRAWNIDFVHGDILDKELVSKLLEDADIVYHLAGITDVAYTRNDINPHRDELITKVGVEGTRNIINSVKWAKIVFPSSHVLFEGLTETKFDLTEKDLIKPELAYSKGKAKSEEDFKSYAKNYVILRLGSVYGYSTDTMRINIVPNLFSKITSQNGTIKLFSGGVQYKSFVNVIDVARCMKFVGESKLNQQTYHLSNENMTIRDIAHICKNNNSNVKLMSTKDVIPNLGYTLSNKKLLKTGFSFLYNIHDSIKEMVTKWSAKPYEEYNEKVITGSDEFVDERGKISNYELSEPINLVGYIESKEGTVRANHFHPIQEQKCLLIKGKYLSVTKDLLSEPAPIQTKMIRAGDLAVIPPNVAHAMVFLEDSIFLNLVNGDRNHENFGITHTLPYILVTNKMAKRLINEYRVKNN